MFDTIVEDPSSLTPAIPPNCRENKKLREKIASLNEDEKESQPKRQKCKDTAFVTSPASLTESHYKDAFQHSTTGMAIATPGGNFVQANRSFFEVASSTPQELTKLSVFNLTAQDQLSKAFHTLSEWLQRDSSDTGSSIDVKSSISGFQLNIQKLYDGDSEKKTPHCGLLVSLVQR